MSAMRWKPVTIAYHILENYRAKRRAARGVSESHAGATHTGMSLEDSLKYVDTVFEDYLQYGELRLDSLKDKRVLELGPGDNFGVALKFLIAGAKQVVCLDRFYSKRDTAQQQRIYSAMRDELSETERSRFDSSVTIDEGISLNEEKLLYIHGTGIESADEILEHNSFDLIVSRAVLEHLYDLDAAFQTMDSLLAPGGSMIHKVDFRDHGMFSSVGFHPLTFLTINDTVYRWMTLHSGRPNRRLLAYYRHKMQQLGYDHTIRITRLVGSYEDIVPHKEKLTRGEDYGDSEIQRVEDIRPKLHKRYRAMPTEDLLAAGAFIVAGKHNPDRR